MASGTITNFANDSGASYCKMPDGTLIQWGTITIPEGLYVEGITFSKAFLDTNYSLTCAVYDSGILVNINSKYTGWCRVGRTPNTAANSIGWQAIGRWK